MISVQLNQQGSCLFTTSLAMVKSVSTLTEVNSMKKTVLALSLAVALGVGQAAAADVLVDTGPGQSQSGVILDGDPGILDWSQSWWAGQFELADAATLSGFDAWMSVSTGGALTVRLYDAASGLPGAATELYSTTFDVAQGGNDWYGASGLAWSVGPGAYWLSFEPEATSFFSGALWMQPSEPSPHYAMKIRSSWELDPRGREAADTFGIRIYGSAVPEPTTWLLMIAGFFGIGTALRRRPVVGGFDSVAAT